MRLDDALRQGLRLLEQEAVPSARLASEVLLMFALDCDRAHLYAHPERELTDSERVHYARYLRERTSGKPTQYITGRQEFWGLEFRVTPAALIPRPETEHVVERAVEVAKQEQWPAPLVVDAGTGSGCIAIALAAELPRARIVATDISAAALALATQNAARLAAGRVGFCRCDLLAAIAPATADLVLSNPPYVPSAEAQGLQREIRDFEPPEALFAGPDGLDVYRALVPEAARVLRPGGWAIFELGYNMADRVRSLFCPATRSTCSGSRAESGGQAWRDVALMPDLAGIPRVISARRSLP